MKEKNYNLELIRLISFVLVIAIHVSNYFCRAYGEIGQGEYLFSLAVDTAARLSVPCFFMISGALLLGREEPAGKHLHRTLRFLFALVFWSAVYYFWNIYYMKSSFDLKEILYVPAEAHLWYLYAMIPIYLVLPFFQIMCRHMDIKMEKLFFLVTTGWVLFNFLLWIMGGEAYYDLPVIGDRIYAWYLFAGYFIWKYRRHIRISQRALTGTCVLAMAATFGITWGVTAYTGTHYEDALSYISPTVVIAALSFFLLMLRLGDGHINPGEKTRKVIDLFCGCSFGIYLIHILFLDNYKKYMEPSDLSAWIAVPGLVAVITAASFVCVWVIRRTKAGRKIT